MGNVIFNSDLLIHARKYLKNKNSLLGVDYKLELKPNCCIYKKAILSFKKLFYVLVKIM